MNISYDVCIVCMNYIKNDARSLNLALTLTNLSVKVLVICVYDNSKPKFPFDTFDIKVPADERLYKLMLKFLNDVNAKKHELKAEYYVASELYSLPTARKLKKIYGGNLIYDSREIYSAIGNLHNQPIKQFIFSRIEKYMINDVDDVIVSGRLDAEHLKTIFPQRINYHLIMNVPPQNKIENNDLLREHFGIAKDRKILLYQGMLMQGRGIEAAIKSMKFLDDYALVIMGAGDEMREQFAQLSQENGVSEKVYFKTPVTYTELHQWTCSADIGLALFEPISLSYKLALPNKLFEYAMAGIPSISTNLPAIQYVIQDHKFSYLIDYPFTPKDISEAVKKIFEPNSYKKFQIAANSASEIYNYQAQIPTIKKVFNIR